jgi:hypothetical protein
MVSNTFEKTIERRCLCRHYILDTTAKDLLLYLKLFSKKSQRHDPHIALAQTIALMMFVA